MIKSMVLFILVSITYFSFASEAQLLLKNIDFSNNLQYWQSAKLVKDSAFQVQKENNKNILKISSGKQDICQLVQRVNISPEKLLNKRISLFATIKVNQLSSGALHLCVREVNNNGKTIRYRTIKITKWSPKGWQKYNISFVVKNPTKYLQVFIKSNYLSKQDSVLLKDLKLNLIKQ